MGEIADAMLDGTLCEGCGCYIGLDTGNPGYCSRQCAKDRGAEDIYEPNVPRFDRYAVKKSPSVAAKVACPVCQRRVKAVGLGDHVRVVHPETQQGSSS